MLLAAACTLFHSYFMCCPLHALSSSCIALFMHGPLRALFSACIVHRGCACLTGSLDQGYACHRAALQMHTQLCSMLQPLQDPSVECMAKLVTFHRQASRLYNRCWLRCGAVTYLSAHALDGQALPCIFRQTQTHVYLLVMHHKDASQRYITTDI